MFLSYRKQPIDWFSHDENNGLNQFQSSVAFHIETSHLICSANQMNGFYIKCNTWMKWVKWDNEGENWKNLNVFQLVKMTFSQRSFPSVNNTRWLNGKGEFFPLSPCLIFHFNNVTEPLPSCVFKVHVISPAHVSTDHQHEAC